MSAAAAIPRSPLGKKGLVRFGPLAAALVLPLLLKTYPGWIRMWIAASVIWVGCKWTMPWGQTDAMSPQRLAIYWLLWPGMDPKPFEAESAEKTEAKGWLQGTVHATAGALLVLVVAPRVIGDHPLAGGWCGWIGLILLLHFGLFHLLAMGLRQSGIPVQPLMKNPLGATSLTDFWGRRWNHAFQEVAQKLLFKPVARRLGAPAATLSVFLASGLVHELVITVPAGGGYGLPTLYFLIQGVGLLFERGPLVGMMRMGGGWFGRTFALLVATAPVMLLFPPLFIHRVVVPMIRWVAGLPL
jgi:hypothetical protein